MKNILLICLATLLASTGMAQQTVEKKGKLFNGLTERYLVLADSPEVKHGLYQVIIKKTPIVSGQYTHGNKTGIWHFFDSKGTLVQNYNYNSNRLLYESTEDSTSAMRYLLDANFTVKDTVTKPIRIGGHYFGYLPYLSQFVLPPDISPADAHLFIATVELFVSPGGRLARYKIHVTSPVYNYNKAADITLDALGEEDKIFIPATVNGKAVPSTIVITCRITGGGKLEYR